MKFNGPADRTIKPGASEKLEVTLSSGKNKGDFSKTLAVTTNDPRHPNETLTCRAKVLVPIQVNPASVNFGQISRKDSTKQQKVVITRGDLGSLALKLTPTESPGLVAQLHEIEPGERYELEVTLNPPFPSEPLRANLTLETGIAEVPILPIPVYATLAPWVVAQPPRFTVPMQRTPDWQEIVRLVWDDDTPHKILDVSTDDAELTVRVDEAEDQQRIVLQVPGEYATQARTRNVSIKTDDPQSPEVRVPVTFARPAKPADTKRPVAKAGGVGKSRPAASRARVATTSDEPTPTSAPAKVQETPPDSAKPAPPEPANPAPAESK